MRPDTKGSESYWMKLTMNGNKSVKVNPLPEKMNAEEKLRRKNAFDGSLVMGAENFNRATGRDRHFNDGLDSLIDEITNLIKSRYTKDRFCPVCGGKNPELLFVKRGFQHVRCPECALIYVNPVLIDEAVLEHYTNETSWVQVLESGPQVKLDRLKYEYGLDTVGPYLDGNDLLDVGTGTGLFLKVAAGQGMNPTGLELNGHNVSRLRQEGFDIVDQPLEQADFGARKFDLVTFWEVLEHLVEPGPPLEQAGRVLKHDGLLLILVPNADSLATRILHEKSGTFGGHSHVNHFNINNLNRLLDKCGFEMMEAETIITELGAINNYLSFEDPYFGRAPAQLDVLSPKFIHENMLGSKLLVLAGHKNKGSR